MDRVFEMSRVSPLSLTLSAIGFGVLVVLALLTTPSLSYWHAVLAVAVTPLAAGLVSRSWWDLLAPVGAWLLAGVILAALWPFIGGHGWFPALLYQFLGLFWPYVFAAFAVGRLMRLALERVPMLGRRR